MEQLQALRNLTAVVDALGFALTVRMLAGIAKGEYRERMEDADYKRACDDIGETLTIAANLISGEK